MNPARLTVIRPSGREVGHGIRVLTALPEGEVPALVLLGVKPQKLEEEAPMLARILEPKAILVSILAGTRQAAFRARFPAPNTIVRAMPNMPVRLRKGTIGLFTDSGDEEAKGLVDGLMAALGLAEWVKDEEAFDLVTALAGSGPAFLYRFVDALGQAAHALGLPADQAARLALATVEGAAALTAERRESPAALAERVASPGGSTRAGLSVLDEEERLLRLLTETLAASVRRNRELAALSA